MRCATAIANDKTAFAGNCHPISDRPPPQLADTERARRLLQESFAAETKRRSAEAERLYFSTGYGVTVSWNVSAGEAVIGDDPVVTAFTVML